MDEVGRPTRRKWDPRLLVALAAGSLFHGALLATGSQKGTYDAYVHLFFADHYSRSWFSSWEPRWYTGFPVVSYPPGTHQLLALLRGAFGVDGAYLVVQLGAMMLVIVGVYRFSHLWVGRRAAGWAAIAAAVSSALAEVVHVFGQLPTTVALAFLLNAQPSISRWLERGHRRDLVSALALMAATTAVHHVTTLFGSVFFTGPVVARVLLDAFARPRGGEIGGHPAGFRRDLVVPLMARRVRRMVPELRRTVVFGASTLVTLVVVILPYWLWSSRDPIVQVPIPHGSRDNFLENLDTGLVFWLLPWASVLLVLPFAVARGLASRTWPLAASVLVLFLLGTGGTTPVPRALLGGAFDILTMDRFTIWATVAILPLVGVVVDGLVDRNRSRDLRRALGERAPSVVLGLLLAVAITSTLFASALSSFRPMQPDAVDADPIVAFLAKDDHDRWRYLLLGFGDQMASISAETTALTVDGNYHSARRLPELTSRAVERLEGAKFRGVPGLGSLQQFLGNPGRYSLKFVFVNDAFYEPLLWSMGWQRLDVLDNDVVVWERPDVAPLPVHEVRPEIPGWQRLMWGVLPLAALVMAAAALVDIGRGQPRPNPVPAARTGFVHRVLARLAEPLSSVDLGEDRVRLVRLPSWPGPATPVRRIRVLASCVVGVLALGATWVAAGDPPSPGDVIVSYYDHLDFQRFDEAWALLDEGTRPALSDQLAARSLRDGLLDGYAQLDAIEILSTTFTDTGAMVVVRLGYLTAIEPIEVTRSHDLRRRGDGWGIVADELVPTATTDFLRRVDETSYLEVRQPSVTAGPVLTVDRPTLALGPASLLRSDSRWFVVGEVTNTDGDPAHVTIEATLRDADGNVLITAEATGVTVHTVLPGETVPYRVLFEGRAGAIDPADPAAGEFFPGAYTPPALARDVAGVEVSARAVVTSRGARRDLALQDVALDPVTGSLSASVVNTGVHPVTVPHVVYALYDRSGRVVWVDDTWLAASVAPGERAPITISPGRPTDVELLDVPVRLYADVTLAATRAGVGRIDLTGALDPFTIALHLTGFDRGRLS